jgi:hypothetical protein
MRTARGAVLAASLAAWPATGCIGLWRGEYYAGLSSGDLEACVPFNFDVSIEEGGRIRGVAATEHRWGTVSWDDPRVPESHLRWRGRRHAVWLEVTQEGDGGCPAPRRATLHRK